MPANLPPQYIAAEKEFRAAKTPQEKIEALERMLAIMPHHKGTDHLRAELRTRIAKLTQEAERQRGSGRTQMYVVRKEGVGQAMLVGLPNAGKSSLLAALTGAPAKVAAYPYTTQLPQPAMMPFEDIQVQLVDLPPITPGESPGWMRGLLRQADLLLLVVDLSAGPLVDLQALFAELESFRMEPVRPGGPPGDDVLQVSTVSIVVASKLDLPNSAEMLELLSLDLGERLPLVSVSSADGRALEELRRATVDALDVVRVYAKPPGRPADMSRPFVFPRGATVTDLADDIHHDLLFKFKYAVLWPANRPAVRVARDYVLQDRDVIELHAG